MGSNVTVSGGTLLTPEAASPPTPELLSEARGSGGILSTEAGGPAAREARRAAGEGRRAHLGLVAGRRSPGPPEPGPAAGRRPPRG